MNQLIALLDGIKLPIDIPLLMHPPIVHFAIAIPLIALLLEISNVFLKRRCIGVISSLLLLLGVVVYFAAFFSGKTDGKEAYALLSQAGQEELKEHKTLGIYLVYGMGIVFVLKLIFASINKTLAKAIFALILAIFVALVLKQGKDGGELVYKYGANVAPVSALDDKIMDLEDEVDTLKSELEKCKSAAKPAAAAPTPAKTESAEPQEAAPATQEAAPATQEAPAAHEPKTDEQKSEQHEATPTQELQHPAAKEHEAAQESPKSAEAHTEESNATKTQESIKEKAAEALQQIKKNVEGNVSAH